MKHTLGPWGINWQTGYAVVYANFWEQICVVQNNNGEKLGVMSADVQAANARLIAAAPDLLEALQDMVSDRKSLSDATVEFARAAIAKATGAA